MLGLEFFRDKVIWETTHWPCLALHDLILVPRCGRQPIVMFTADWKPVKRERLKFVYAVRETVMYNLCYSMDSLGYALSLS